MNKSTTSTLKEYLEHIMGETSSRSMKWGKSNPTTFVWSKLESERNPGAPLTLQRVGAKKMLQTFPGMPRTLVTVFNYIFQAAELPSGALKLVINTQTEPDLKETLSELYETIAATIDQQGVDFLKQIIG
jgi:hypothetical protein